MNYLVTVIVELFYKHTGVPAELQGGVKKIESKSSHPGGNNDSILNENQMEPRLLVTERPIKNPADKTG